MANEPEPRAPTRGDPRNDHRAKTVIQARPRVNTIRSIVLAAGFALLATPIVLLDSWLQGAVDIEAGEESPITVRIPQFSGFGAEGAPDRMQGGQVVVARGQMVDAQHEALVARVMNERPSSTDTFLAFFAGLFLLALLYSQHLRRSHRGRLLRTQIVTLGMLVAAAAAFQVLLLLTPISVLVVPVAGLAIIATLAVDVSVGLATGLAVSMLMAFLVPFDAGTVAVLSIQSFAGVLGIAGRKDRSSRMLFAGVMGGLAAATAYIVFYYLANHTSPFHELADPLRSAWVASFAGGVLSGILAIFAQPAYQWLMGEITKNRLVELEDLSNPLLKRIAQNAPGTWQHSLAMANMAEIAANSIGANGRLVRVGAYYHDLGKSLQPTYFIENLRSGEQSPHDRLPPGISCDAIFAHVTEGVRVARKEGLPERIIDFMHMHHGDGLLEYFWAKCQEQGNPESLSEDDFRYPGVKPQTRETAILAICDAVEAASRTLKNPDEYAIRNLVQRIVYGKLHLGQLDESGLTVADLQRISNSLEETIKHAFHGRIEYPWQRKEREQNEAEQLTQRERPRAPSEMAVQASSRPRPKRLSATQRIISQPRLDSLDVPRPYWGGRGQTVPQNPTPAEIAPTERVSDQVSAEQTAADPSQPAAADATPTERVSDQVSVEQAAADPSEPPPADMSRAETPPPARAEAPAPVAEPGERSAPPVGHAEALATDDSDQPTDLDEHPAHQEPNGDPAEAVVEPVQDDGEVADDEHETVLILNNRKDDDAAERAATVERAEPASPPPAEAADNLSVWSEALETAAGQEPAGEPPTTEAAPEPAPVAEPHTADPDEAPTSVRKRPPPPPGAAARHGRGTIPLMGEDAFAEEDAPADGDRQPRRAVTRADSEDGELSPGMMVLGPPPATHKPKKKRNES